MPRSTTMVGVKHDINSMKNYIITVIVFSCLLQSCNSKIQIELKNQDVEGFLSEMALIYWDYNYTFPTSYLQSRNTNEWLFSHDTIIDSILLYNASDIIYTNQDTALLITYRSDTIALIQLPCSCDWTDEIPYGPRAYDSLGRIILDELILIGKDAQGEDAKQIRLTHELVNNLFPAIEKRMNKNGYVKVNDVKREYPQYLLIEYLSENDSIQLIKACQKYSCFFYDEYTKILRTVFSYYCKNNHVSRLLTPVDVYIPISEKITMLDDL